MFMENYYICIDIGGTDIKFGIIDEDYKILYKSKISSAIIVKSQSFKPAFEEICNILNEKTPYNSSKAKGVGISFPGLVDSKNNEVKYLPNLKLNKYDSIKRDFEVFGDIPVKIANDAELALLAERWLGEGRGKTNFILLTLGTGLGCGIVIDGKQLRTNLPYSCECGNLNTLESGTNYGALVSTKALVNQTKKAMQDNPNSKMWSKYNLSTVSGRTVFEFKDIDKPAKSVFDNYIKNLGTVIANLFTLLSPETIIIGGGISEQGKELTKPLEDFANKNTFMKNIGSKVNVIPAKFTNDAGILGARCLFN